MNQSRKASVSNVLASYANKKKGTATGMTMVAFDMLGDHSAKIFIASGSKIDLTAARQFVFDKLNHTMIPFNASYTEYKDNSKCLASIICYRNKYKTKDTDTKFSQISASSYLDTELGDIWEAKEVDGKKMFVRENTDEISKVLSDLSMTASKNYRIEASAFNPTVSKGDYIEFFARTNDSADICIGQVVEVDAEAKVNVVVGNVKADIPKASVIRVLSAVNKSEVIEYLKKAYANNPEYQAQLERMI